MPEEFLDKMQEASELLIRRGKSAGPCFGNAPLIWGGQEFAIEAEPMGTIESKAGLYARGSNSGLQVVLIANANNEEPLVVAGASQFTLTTSQADSLDGAYLDAGPSICFTSPDETVEVEPGQLVCSFPLAEPEKPYIKAKLEIIGSVTGGKVDLALAYVPR